MRRKLSAYVANPKGFNELNRVGYYTVLLPLLERYVKVLNPWGVMDGYGRWPNPEAEQIGKLLANAKTPQEQKAHGLEMADVHYDTIEKRADLVIAVLDDEPPDNGTVCEVVWAAAHGTPVIGYRNDFRKSGEEGMIANLMIEGAIRRSGGFTVSSLEELERHLVDFLDKIESTTRDQG